MKRLGNVRPELLRRLESAVWVALILVARGVQSAYDAYFCLHNLWKDDACIMNMPAESRFFFKQGIRPLLISAKDG